MNRNILTNLSIWMVFTLFIFGTIFPILTSTFFCEEITKTEIKTTPTKIDTYICYVTKKGNNYHARYCRYIEGKKITSTTIYEALEDGYNECNHCNPKTEIKIIVDTETKTEKREKEYNYHYPLAICSAISFLVFIPTVLVHSKNKWITPSPDKRT